MSPILSLFKFEAINQVFFIRTCAVVPFQLAFWQSSRLVKGLFLNMAKIVQLETYLPFDC